MNKRMTVILGSRSQSHPMYGSSAGKQCTAMSLAFSVYNHQKSPSQVRYRDMDNILNIGNVIYEYCSNHFETEILAADEIPTDITFEGLRYKLAIGQVRYGFIQDKHNLVFHFTNVFCTYEQAFFICNGYTVMLKYSQGQYFVFDSHKKDRFGRKHADGKSSIITFVDFNEMVRYLTKLHENVQRVQYDLVPLKITSELAKTGTRPEVRCHFRRNRAKVVNQYEPNVLEAQNVSLEDLQSEGNDSRFIQSKRKKSISPKKDMYSGLCNLAKRYKSDVSTCVIDSDNSILCVDDECVTSSAQCSPDFDQFSSPSCSDNMRPESPKPSTSKSKSPLTVTFRKKGKTWCQVKGKDIVKLRKSDKEQIETINNTFSAPHGMIVHLQKLEGTWHIKSKDTGHQVHVVPCGSTTENRETDLGDTYASPREQVIIESQESSEPSAPDQMSHFTSPSPKRSLSMTPSAIRQRIYREKKKLEKLEAQSLGSTCENIVHSHDSQSDFLHDTVQNSDNVSSFSTKRGPYKTDPLRNYSMTRNAQLKREQRKNERGETSVTQNTPENIEILSKIAEDKLKCKRLYDRERQRNYRQRRRSLYEETAFKNNEWSTNTHFGNPCTYSVPNMTTEMLDNLPIVTDLSDVVSITPVTTVSYETVYQEMRSDEIHDILESETDSVITQSDAIYSANVRSNLVDSDDDVDEIRSQAPLREFNVDTLNDDVEYTFDNFQLSENKVKLLNASLDHVCIYCTKLCFLEQGSYITDLQRIQFDQYLNPDSQIQYYFVCSSCYRQVKKHDRPTFNQYQGIFWPQKVGDLDIYPHEERLIALRIPFMHIQVLPSGAQKSLRGNIINVPADIHETVNMLPRHLNESNTVTVRLKRRMQYKGVYAEYNVRPIKVLNALQYLKEHSTYYQDSRLSISKDWLTQTIEQLQQSANLNNCSDARDDEPENTSAVNDSHENDNTTYDTESESESDNFSEVDHTETPVIHDTMLDIIPDMSPLNIAPGENQRPVNLLFDKHGEEMSFPTIYCGKAIDEIYPSHFNFLKRTRWELCTEDRRLAQHVEMIFYKYKVYQLDYIREQSKFAVRCIKQDKNYRAKDVRSENNQVDIATLDDGFFFFKKLRNSPQYLQQKKRELFATVRQLGIPTFFVSLSAADTRWPYLLQSLGRIVDHKEYSLQEIQEMSFQNRTRLINSDPVTCARFFDRRFQFFLKHILYKPPYPLGKISDHFYRIEFQHRGSPHVHMILFSEDAPKYTKGEDDSSVLSYIDKYISCSLTPAPDTAPYIKYQIHSHSKTCRKGGRPTCRFHFPLPPFDSTIILNPNPERTEEQKKKYKEIQAYLDSPNIDEKTTLDDILQHFKLTFNEYTLIIRSTLKHDKVYLKRKPNECRVNMYMKNLLHVWEANVDCQFCLDPYSVVSYIVNYINKGNRGLSLNLAAMSRQCEKEKLTIRETIKKLGNVFLNTSEICVQECVYILLGLPLTHQSVDVEIINTAKPECRVKVVKSKQEIAAIDDDSTDIFRNSKYDIYRNRPTYFDDWTFADYITKVKITTRSLYSKRKDTVGIHMTKSNKKYFLDLEKRYTIGRKRILSYICPSKSQEAEEYYRIYLILFHPWKEEPVLHVDMPSFKELYTSLTHLQKDALHENAKTFNRQNLQILQDLYTDLTNDVSNLVVAPGADQINAEDEARGSVSLYGGLFFQPVKSNRTTENSSNDPDMYINRNGISGKVNALWPHEKMCQSVTELNDGQRKIYDTIMTVIVQQGKTMHLFLTGGAGTGKTFLLQTLYQSMSRFFNLNPLHTPNLKSVLKVAMTGKAAFIIKGETVHSGLGIRPLESYEFYEKLSADKLNTLHVKFLGTKVILIDEVSLVGTNFFKFVDLRLQEIKGNRKPFGGLHVLCFGDLYQLPPVKDKWVFENNKYGLSSLSLNLWTELFEIYELTEIMRQREEHSFAELLNRMREGNNTENDFKILESCVLGTDVEDDGLDCLHIFSTNKAARDYNDICYQKCRNQKVIVSSVDVIVEVVSKSVLKLVKKEIEKSETQAGTTRYLQLGIGLTYEIDHNINVEDGLFNGTNGILQYIQYMDMYEKPVALWFKFEHDDIGNVQRELYKHYRTREILHTWTPIFATIREFKIKSPKVTIKRKQFPVHQATGKTIHKAQGCTVAEIVIDASSFTFRNGFYVACSRVPKISNLHIANFQKNQIFTDVKVKGEMQRLRENRQLELKPPFFPSNKAWFSIFYNNIQSLPLHFQYLQAYNVVKQANIVVLNESHLVQDDPSEPYNMVGFCMIRFDGVYIPESRRRPYNGLIMYVREQFQVTVVEKVREDRYEYMTINVNDEWNHLNVALVYVAPQTPKRHIQEMFDRLMVNIDNVAEVAILGDFNLNFCDQHDKNFMIELTRQHNLQINETRFTTKQSTTIDYCITRNPHPTFAHFVAWSYHNSLTVQL